MSIVRLCPYAKDEHCKYEIYYGEPLFSKCKNCELRIVADMKKRKDVHKTFNNEVGEMTLQGVDMFEKEAEKWRNSLNYEIDNDTFYNIVIPCIEFGYNKANEWHYVKDELPDEGTYLVVWQNNKGYKEIFIMNYEEDDEEELHWVDGDCEVQDEYIIAWKEIVLPELPKE